MFDFFGFGQPGQGPLPPPDANDAPNVDDWGLWPQEQAQQQPHQQAANINVNLGVQGAGEAFLELNDLIQNNANDVAFMPDFDLNEPLHNDFGDVEDILLENLEQHAAPLVQQQEHIIDASSDSSDSE